MVAELFYHPGPIGNEKNKRTSQRFGLPNKINNQVQWDTIPNDATNLDDISTAKNDLLLFIFSDSFGLDKRDNGEVLCNSNALFPWTRCAIENEKFALIKDKLYNRNLIKI